MFDLGPVTEEDMNNKGPVAELEEELIREFLEAGFITRDQMYPGIDVPVPDDIPVSNMPVVQEDKPVYI